MRHRTLSLRRETLAPLTPGELSAVAGGSNACGLTHGPSVDESCPTIPPTVCWEQIYPVIFTGACG